MTTDKKIELFRKQGWCPVKWAHHPQAIKDLFRKGRFVPKMKACFENAAKLVLASRGTEHEGRVVYVEGHLMLYGYIPIHHAWIEFDGKEIDVTLNNGDELVAAGRIELFDLNKALLQTKRWGDLLRGLEMARASA
ncbi:MAG: hypothetical protein DRH30_00825 [Deltaproteobacteria bacterium]|nr:MAG: hypothetical protein DRH30_00825 [Deltaproteobacteria bacterium]